MSVKKEKKKIQKLAPAIVMSLVGSKWFGQYANGVYSIVLNIFSFPIFFPLSFINNKFVYSIAYMFFNYI